MHDRSTPTHPRANQGAPINLICTPQSMSTKKPMPRIAAGRRAVIKSSSHRWLRGRPGYGPGGKLARLHIYLCIAVTLGERAVMPHIGRQVQPDAVVSAAGCRIDEHLGQWPAQASREPAVPDPPEAAQKLITVHHTE